MALAKLISIGIILIALSEEASKSNLVKKFPLLSMILEILVAIGLTELLFRCVL